MSNFEVEKKGGSSISEREIQEKFRDINFVLVGVIFVVVIMVATLIIDSFHINSATYKEYSEKINTLNILKESNSKLLEENQKNQQMIFDQQKQIIDLLNKLKHGSS